jgi:uncharacterized protein
VSDSDPVLFPPLPQPDELTQFFWDAVGEGRLDIQRCDECHHYLHPPKIVCNACLSTSLSPSTVSGRAKLSTWTIPLQPFDPYYQSQVPYILAVIELDEQPNLKMVTNIVDCGEEDLSIDMPVEVTFREVAPECTLPLFAPAR